LLLASNQKKLVAAFQLFAGIGIYDAVAMAFDTNDACSRRAASAGDTPALVCRLNFDRFESGLAQQRASASCSKGIRRW
jgi:hypothetical protein